MTTTAPAFTLGQRVIVPGTPYHCDPAVQAGGPGVITDTTGTRTFMVTIDGQRDPRGYTFDVSELKPEPTV